MAFPSCFVCFSDTCSCTPVEFQSATHIPSDDELRALDDLIASIISAGPQQEDINHNLVTAGQRPSPTRDVGQTNEAFAHNCFPHPHQQSLRGLLIDILQQYWLLFNQPEPAGAFHFLLQDIGKRHQQCTICSKVSRRGSRALEHIRAHLSHRPFRCNGGFAGCPSDGCGKSFHSQEQMKEHQRRGKIQCEKCRAIVLRKNFMRHLKAQGCSQS